MKQMKAYFLIAAALVSLSLSSCNNNDYYYPDWSKDYPNAVVTVKTADDGHMYLQLNDETTLLPTNMRTSPFGDKEVRALANLQLPDHNEFEDGDEVKINWIDSILTKSPMPFVDGENDALYGSAPVDIMDDFITYVEDGYLTLHLIMPWGDPNIKHRVNLLTGGNPDDPYEVELRHDAEGDTGVDAVNAYVAFRLDELPDTEGETVKLTLKWQSSRGVRSAEFDYRTREDGERQEEDVE
jgi:hypothetical protein